MNKSKELSIYLVNDDVFYLSILEQIFRNLGYENITLFKNGADCLDKLSEKPDIVFLDYNMYIGYDSLIKIKQFDPNIYVIMISSNDDLGNTSIAIKLGAFDYIKKGYNISGSIKRVLKKIIEVKELLR